MDGKTLRTTLATSAFLAIVVAATVGASNRGETYEVAIDDVCEGTVWPMIPAACIDDGKNRDVRMVGMVAESNQIAELVPALLPEFAATASGKGDLLHDPEYSIRYMTVEARRDGISELRRVQIESSNQTR